MTITLGSLLQRLERARDPGERFAFFMPTACGPCRFGVYHTLHKIVLERLGFKERVRLWSPVDSDYFQGVPAGFSALAFTGFTVADTLLEALYDVRPVETRPGAAEAVYRRAWDAVLEQIERAGRGDLSLASAVMQLLGGGLFGCAELLRRAGADLAAVKSDAERPCILVVGEIYVRCDPFSNDFVIDKLERRGIRTRFAPVGEWLEYCDYEARKNGEKTGFGAHLSAFLQRRIQARAYALMARALRWPARTTVEDSLAAARPYIREDLCGEAVLTLGGPLHEWRKGLIDGVVSVGPLECMPNKIAEAQLFHAAEREGLASLVIPVNGDPVDPEAVDNFAFEVHERFRARRAGRAGEGRGAESPAAAPAAR